MNKQELKNKHLELNEYNPFTPKEEQKYSAKDRSMIRNIQILNNFKKKEQAIKVLDTYKGSHKEALRALAKEYKKRLTKGYPKTKPEMRGHIIDTKKKGASKRERGVRQKQREKVAKYLKEPVNQNKVNRNKIAKAHKKYIDASKPELEHGVNSQWSQKYRVKHGLSQKYTGRIIK